MPDGPSVLAEETFNVVLEPDFLEKIEQAKSNIPEHRDGRLYLRKICKTGNDRFDEGWSALCGEFHF